VSYTQWGALHPRRKTFFYAGSFTKTIWISSYTLIPHHKSNNVYCYKHPLRHRYSHILTQGSNVRLSKTKTTLWQGPTHNPLYILARKNGWIIILIHPQCLLNYHIHQSQTQWDHATYYFPTINIHLWMSPFLFEIYFLWYVKPPWIMLSPKINYYIIHESNLYPTLIKRCSW
jgi:hypothetical protein